MTSGGKRLITIDGPAGCGKSTASIELARKLGLSCIDTGAMYRTLAYKALRKNTDLNNEMGIVALAKTLKFRFGFEGETPFVEVSEGGEDFERLGREIRSSDVSKAASGIARLKAVRAELVRQQQIIGNEAGGVIEGRDAGTVIFPGASTKFFLTASAEERARRRHLELVEFMGEKAPDFNKVLEEVRARDLQDEQREHSPLKPAQDAVIVDTTRLSLPEVIETLYQKVVSGS